MPVRSALHFYSHLHFSSVHVMPCHATELVLTHNYNRPEAREFEFGSALVLIS
jgi:hypothetical protein